MSKKKNSSFRARGWETQNDHGHFIRLYDDFCDSPAYKALSMQAREIYRILKREWRGETNDKRFTVPNTVICPYANFVNAGIRRGNVSKGLQELERFGFIQVRSGGLMRVPSQYTFIDDWKNISPAEADKMKEASKAKKAKPSEFSCSLEQ